MNNSVRRITDGAMMIAIVGVLLLIDRQLGNVLTYYLMFLLPLPMVFYSCKYGMKASWPVLAAMVLISFIVSTPDSIFYVASESLLGLIYGSGIRRKVPARKLVILCMLIGVVIQIFDTVVISAMLGYDLPSQVAELTTAVDDAASKAGLSLPGTLDLSRFLTEIVIVASALTGVLQGYVTHVLSRLLLRRLRFHVDPPTPVTQYFPPKWSGYLALAGYIVTEYTMMHPFTNSVALNLVQSAGMIGMMYLAFYGFVAILLYGSMHGRKTLWMYVLLGLFMMIFASMVLLILGFLYITTDLHRRALEGVNQNAERNE